MQSGWQRASHAHNEALSTSRKPFHRHTEQATQELTPGTRRLIRVDLFPFAEAFRPGSRIILTVNGPGGGGNMFPRNFGTIPGGFDVAPSPTTRAIRARWCCPLTSPDANLEPELPDCLGNRCQLRGQIIDVNVTADGVDASRGDGVCG
jgi:uncharacterized protein